MKFQQGELVVFVGETFRHLSAGDEAIVRGFMPLWPLLDEPHYEVEAPSGARCFVMEFNLRKRPHKGIPESILQIFEIKEIA